MPNNSRLLDPSALLAAYEPDTQWYLANIPLLECSDKKIQEIYYFRWANYKKHLRKTPSGYVVTEFLPHVDWEGPFGAISAAAGHHIYEGRWLKNRRYLDDYVSFWFAPGSGIRNYSFWAADSTYAYALANGDFKFAQSKLGAMKANFEAWKDHYDPAKGLYWQRPVSDATEYTAASLDVGDGFNGGDSFRPTINAVMVAEARAIGMLEAQAGDGPESEKYAAQASAIKAAMQKSLWDPKHEQFMDRFSQRYPERYFQFASSPEEAGLVPWYFDVPDPAYDAAWKAVLDPSQLYAPYGPRTLPPSSPYYMVQHRTPGAQPGECEWNGPSWPYQTCMVLGGLANLLNRGGKAPLSAADYFRLLENYTLSQFKDGKPWIAENLNPDTGVWIADFPQRSEYYNHSTYNDLIITGLAGLRPRADDTLQVHPLIPESMDYFCLEDIPYHGHRVGILWDKTGHFGRGTGLKVYVDGRLAAQSPGLAWLEAPLGPVLSSSPKPEPENLALNTKGAGFPEPSASYTHSGDSIWEAVDGRMWHEPMPHNRWSCQGSPNKEDWFAVDFGSPKAFDRVKLYFYADGQGCAAPPSFEIQAWVEGKWVSLAAQHSPVAPRAGCENLAVFAKQTASKVRIRLAHAGPQACAALAEIEIPAFF